MKKKKEVIALGALCVLVAGVTLSAHYSSNNGTYETTSAAPVDTTNGVEAPQHTQATEPDESSTELPDVAAEAPVEQVEAEVAAAEETSEDLVTGTEEMEVVTPSVDVDTLLTTHVVEYEDQDGYRIRETCQLSPIFTEDDQDVMYALWEALGEDVALFPSKESLYGESYLMRDARDTCSCNKLEYIIGTYTIENITDGFPITPDNPRTYTGQLATKHVSSMDEEHDSTAADFFNDRSVTVVAQPDISYYSEQGKAILGVAKMGSNVWGPVHFIIALPNGATPNRPDGYRYDKIPLLFTTHVYFFSDYDAFEVTYFE